MSIKFNKKVLEFQAEVIKEFERHESLINELRKELANKEDKIDINNIKEVKRING